MSAPAPVVYWAVWTDSASRADARRLLRRALAAVPAAVPEGLTVKPYPKTGGHVLRFTTASRATRWADLVLETLLLGNALGYRWSLSGCAESGLAGWSNHAWVEGVASVSWDVDRSDLP